MILSASLSGCASCGVTHCPKIVITGDGPVKDQLIGGVLLGAIVSFLFIGCQIITSETPEQEATHKCWYEATLAARAAGNKNFSYAKKVSPTNAKLVFKKAGNVRVLRMTRVVVLCILVCIYVCDCVYAGCECV